MSSEFLEVHFHRMRYFLSPQFDMYRNVRKKIIEKGGTHGSVLDYGCGNGVGCVLLKSDKLQLGIYGVDSDDEAVRFAGDAWGHLASFEHGDWSEDLGDHYIFPQFDNIVCLEVIEHVKDPDTLLSNLRSSCAPDASVFISTLNHNSQYRKNAGHIGKFHVEDFRALLERHFPGVRLYNYDFSEELDDNSTLTPMVAVWKDDA